MRKKLVMVSVLLVLALAVFATPSLAMQAETRRNEMKEMHGRNRIFVAHLNGKLWTSRVDSNVTYGPIKTRAQGQAIFHISKNGAEIEFMLIAANIMNIIMAHIHLDNGSPLGPIVVWLYPRMPPMKEIPGRFNGILAKGTINATSLVGPLQDMPLSTLIQKMESGNAYVVIHTTQHPQGEIRGWIH